MRLGIFAKTFPHSSLKETLDAVRAYGRAACSSIVSERLYENSLQWCLDRVSVYAHRL
jgi:hypothetical protein